jgi:hypothetical protein
MTDKIIDYSMIDRRDVSPARPGITLISGPEGGEAEQI